MVVEEWDISKILVQINALKKTGQEIKKEMGMSEPEALNHCLEKGTGKEKEIPDHHQGTEIQHCRVMIPQLVLVALLLETKTRISKS